MVGGEALCSPTVGGEGREKADLEDGRSMELHSRPDIWPMFVHGKMWPIIRPAKLSDLF